MLLESNNIRFEPTLKNISQMAAKLFGSNEEPMVDDFPQDDAGTSNTNDPIDNNGDGSWRDVEEIFETFNKPVAICQALRRSQQRETLIESKEEQSDKLAHHKDFDDFKATKRVGIMKSADDVGSDELSSNKKYRLDSTDQLQNLKGSGNNCEHLKSPKNIPSSVQVVSSTTVPNQVDISEQTARQNDQTNRVRQVNVEIYTLTLKPPKDKQASDNN